MSLSPLAATFHARRPPTAAAPLRNMPFGPREGTPLPQVRPAPEHRQQTPRGPEGALVGLMLSALSGAVAGFALAGHLSLAVAVFLTLPAGIAIGMWARGLGD